MNLATALSLEEEPAGRLLLDQEEPIECRFCHCTDFTPCAIAIAQDQDGTVRLARSAAEAIDLLSCQWYIDGVCNAPRCLEKLIAEWGCVERGPARVLLFDASGRQLISAEDRVLDSEADDRDFNMIGRALGLELQDITREAILERIRELRDGGKRRSA